ncbi:MAG: DNA polymerase III subunit gamma/tau [Saprospiraceae bacterium]
MSNFIVSARKYRPTRFSDVVGQEHVGQTLKNAQKNDHLAHAFLFCGPRGVGKTTCARILAKVLNCLNKTDEFEPCNECDNCKAFAESSTFNIVELDAASNNSVDHIRQLVEQVRFQPQQGQYKIFIIDEVHMLSQAAFNAFLKTLEEPPPYAIFILATTEKHKIIPTILSRCQIFDFRRIQIPAIVKHLEGICKDEGITAEHDALHIIAQKADGALRDALSIFDRVVSFSGKSLTYEDVITNLNVLDYDYYFRFTDALLTENVSEVMLIFDDILRKGFEADIFINGLGEHLRNLLVCKDVATLQLLEVSDDLKKRYQQQAAIALNSFLLTALNLANDCDVNYKMARNKRLHVEMALIKMAYIGRAVSIAENPQAISVATGEKKSLVEPPNGEQTLLSVDEPKSDEKPLPQQNTTTTEVLQAEFSANKKTVENEVTELGYQKTPIVEDTVNETAIPPISEAVENIPPEVIPPHEVNNAPASSVGLSSKFNTMSLNLDSLIEEVEQESAVEEEDIELPPLTVEGAQEVWLAYAKQHDQNSVRTTLQNTELKIENEEVVAVVGSSLGASTIRDERPLVGLLRNKFKRSELALRIEIDQEKVKANAAPTRRKPLTIKEKYYAMQEVNPLVRDIIMRFELKPDED